MQEKSRNRGRSSLAICLSILSTLAIGSAAIQAETKNTDLVLEGLQRRYESTADYVADFRQETELKALNRTLKAWGKVFFRRPGKMLWRYEQPKDQVVLADGKYLYYYQPEEKQVIKSPLSSSFRSDVPVSFLLGMGNLKRDFKATLLESEREEFLLQLVPKVNTGGIGEVLLGIQRNDFDIVWAQFHDLGGNVITIRLSGIKRGVGLSDSLFRLRVPEGVDVFELGS